MLVKFIHLHILDHNKELKHIELKTEERLDMESTKMKLQTIQLKVMKLA